MNEAELQARIESLQQTNMSLAEYMKVERATWRAKVAELEAKLDAVPVDSIRKLVDDNASMETRQIVRDWLDSYQGVQDASR
jgi:predicted nuclease with TOPRIM domain